MGGETRMMFGQLIKRATFQGDIKLTLWKDGEVVDEKIISGTEDLKHAPGLGLWAWLYPVYIFAAPDGFLHFDFEVDYKP